MCDPEYNDSPRESGAGEDPTEAPAGGPEAEPEDRETLPARRPGWAASMGLALVGFYQDAISPALPPSCRFRPTCSEYTRIAIRRHGLLKGSWLGLKRILKCHPFHPGGHDPVP